MRRQCGDLKHEFARVRCPRCREEFFLPYSCRVRCFRPSCHEKRALEKAGWVAEHICAEVPHRQFVFTIPKRLAIYFRFERRLLGDLCRAAARTVTTVSWATSGRTDAVPGMAWSAPSWTSVNDGPAKRVGGSHPGHREPRKERQAGLVCEGTHRPSGYGRDVSLHADHRFACA